MDCVSSLQSILKNGVNKSTHLTAIRTLDDMRDFLSEEDYVSLWENLMDISFDDTSGKAKGQ